MTNLLSDIVESHHIYSQIHATSELIKKNLQSHDAAVLSIAVIRLDCEDPIESIRAIEFGATSIHTAEQLRVALDASILEHALEMIREPADLPLAVDFINLLGSSEEAKRKMRIAIAGQAPTNN